MSEILEFFRYAFVQRALIAGSMISICASVLGVMLVLKHYSLIGHGLSEIGFASLSISSALNIPEIFIAVPSVVSASFIIMSVSRKYKTAGDIAIAVVSSAALALGIIISSLAGTASNINSYLFGSVLAISQSDMTVSIIFSLSVITAFIIFYNRLFLITYSEDYARSLGISTAIYQSVISFLTALTVVMGMKIMGTLLISGVIILPAVSAKSFAGSFKALVMISAMISLTAFISGLIFSFIFNLPVGAGVIIVNTAILITVKIFVREKN